MASVRQKCGKWYYRITVTNGDGSHKWIERGSFRTKKEALDAGNKVEVLLKEGELPIKQRAMTFRTLAAEMLESSETRYKRSSIHAREETLKRFLYPFIGDHDIKGISKAQCQKIIDDAAKEGHTRNRLSSIKGTLNVVFNYGVLQGYLKESPARMITLPSPRSIAAQSMKKEREIRILPKEEMDAIFKRFPEGSSMYILFLLGYRCGLRKGEVLGLLVSDIDFKASTLHIRRQLQFDHDTKELYFTYPKYCNPGEGRDVVMDPDTCKILKRHVDKLLKCQEIFHYPSYYIGKNGVLNNESGKLVLPVCLRYKEGTFVGQHAIQSASKVIHGVKSHIDYVDPDFEFHALRHTHASECLAAGMSPVSVQKRLGHRNLSTTLKYYVHETKSQEDQSAEVLAKMFQ